jgi:hypothetical protein
LRFLWTWTWEFWGLGWAVVEDSIDMERDWREEDGRDCSDTVPFAVVFGTVVFVVVVTTADNVADAGRRFLAASFRWT